VPSHSTDIASAIRNSAFGNWPKVVHHSSVSSDSSERSSDVEISSASDSTRDIKNYYISHYREHPSLLDLLNDLAFEFEEHKWGGQNWYTARFVCPVTKQVYEAGKLSNRDIYEQWKWSKETEKPQSSP
jgi:hypothetical protein